ncbi:LpxL/LpxP family Kdo(2)-lipid IV(A) lauroyl/palmitoleoyl acyltransferase [Candidatus Venteria ishoeyi]|uniref:Lipid A biosynthesis lauroyl acyltransferase n=1 Tax=Candidatus Venteria ishoeyi TaxID=1899563 RepID=A0A1H6FBU9_9GAMM|nr:LpxL/LpxP family Kdo(2)-lipid IV(A) lauroyl/palmitoleoyl acyltransferase [Candidatus Venteria ishoeyi]SEH06475.1 Lipid A biosynthesis lauroyl acyltransferase [Candidatus Venteria ishoeyi]
MTVPRNLRHPRYWLLWAAIALLRLLTLLPYAWQMAVGTGLGQLFRRLSKRRVHIARRNLQLCFPEMPDNERETLLQAHFSALGQGLMEVGIAWWASPQWLARHVDTTGLEYVQQAQQAGKPVILLSAHFTPVELSLLVDIPGAGLTFRPHENPLLDYVITQSRQRRGKHTVSRNNIREMLRVLKQSGVLWIAPDQSYAGSNSTFAPFFGVPAATTTLLSLLVKRTGAVVVPFFVQKRESGQYHLWLSSPLEDFAQADETRATTMINQAIESGVKRAPEQYYWVHRRFKHRPSEEENVY